MIHLPYIIRCSIVLAVLHIVYIILFKNNKDFIFNRIYLLASIFASILIPLATYTVPSNFTTAVYLGITTTVVSEEVVEISNGSNPDLWLHISSIIYYIGCMCLLLRLCFGIVQLYTIKIKARKVIMYDSSVYITSKNTSPFSFIKYIFLSEHTLNNPNLRLVIAHEKIHVSENHFIDIFITEVYTIFQWFNPVVWFLKKDINNNIEYSTDASIIALHDETIYQMTMVSIAQRERVAPFTAALNNSQIKKRIIMMKKSNNSKHNLAKRVLLIPVFICIFLGMANSTTKPAEVIDESGVYQKDNTSKDENPNLKLRRTFAKNIKFPTSVLATGKGMTINLLVDVDKNGKFSIVNKASSSDIVSIGKIAITAIGLKYEKDTIKEKDTMKDKKRQSILEDECKRVIEVIGTSPVKEWYDKTLKFEVQFLIE